jgi:hypothetical protein
VSTARRWSGGDLRSEGVQRRIVEAAERLTRGFDSESLGGMTRLRRVGGRTTQSTAGTRVVVESESTERPARTGVIEEVLREVPSARYRIRWDDGYESIYTLAAGALRAVEAAERQ